MDVGGVPASGGVARGPVGFRFMGACLGVPLAIAVWLGDNYIVSKTRALGQGLDRVRVAPRRRWFVRSRG
jgi:hypothetical protein